MSDYGHYYSYIKSFENGEWFRFCDSQVLQVDLESVLIDMEHSGYLLFYREVDPTRNLDFTRDNQIPIHLRESVLLDQNEINN